MTREEVAEQRDEARYEAIMIVNELHKSIDYSVYCRLIDLIDMLGLPDETCTAEYPKPAQHEQGRPTTQPDPETGLVPCGCGGKAQMGKLIYTGIEPDLMPEYYAHCRNCEITTENSDDRERVKNAWNTAMGWRVEG